MSIGDIFMYVTLGSSAMRAILAAVKPLVAKSKSTADDHAVGAVEGFLNGVDGVVKMFSHTAVDKMIPGVKS